MKINVYRRRLESIRVSQMTIVEDRYLVTKGLWLTYDDI